MVLSTALTASFADSAATPALHVKSGSEWTVKAREAGCEIAVSNSDDTLPASRNDDSGTWSGSANGLTMEWTAGANTGLAFLGCFDVAAKKYVGTFSGSTIDTGAVVKGSTPRCSWERRETVVAMRASSFVLAFPPEQAWKHAEPFAEMIFSPIERGRPVAAVLEGRRPSGDCIL